MRMGMSMGCYQRCEQRILLSHAQKLGLQQMLLLEQRLKHPEYPNTVKGLEGMQIAHTLLQERNRAGVLIGGLAEAVWNQQRTPEELSLHKDVDVAVLSDSFLLEEKFEGGIDWWTPHTGKITVKTDYSAVTGKEQRWYANGNGVVLSFGIRTTCHLPPGLYIPDSEWVVDMREYEADANIDHAKVEVEYGNEVIDKFRKTVRQRVKTRVPAFIRETFAGYILSPDYEDDYYKRIALNLERFDLETIRAINKHEE